MKLKKFVCLGLAAISAVAMTACGPVYESQLKKDTKTYAQYVTLGEYMNVEVEVDRSTLDVSDEDIDEYINNLLEKYTTKEELTEGVTKKGDAIILDYSGAIDGEKFSGGTATDASYTIGSELFIKDLDKGLEGLTLGEEYEIPCVFPDNYQTVDYRGKKAIFTVTVKKIVVTNYPAIDDEIIGKLAEDKSWEIKTESELRAKVKETIAASKEEEFESQKNADAWSNVIENSNVSGYDEKELAQLEETIKNNVKSQFESYGSYYGITTFEDWIKNALGFEKEDDYNTYVTDYAKSYLDEKMVVTMIADKEGITVEQKEIESLGEETAKQYEFDSYKALYKEFGDDIDLEMGYQILWDKVFNLVKPTFVEVEKKK